MRAAKIGAALGSLSLLLMACQTAGPAGSPYDGLWTADIANDGFALNLAVAISGGAFNADGTATSTTICTRAPLAFHGTIAASGLVSGGWQYTTVCNGTTGTFAGTCQDVNTCTATGSMFVLRLTRGGVDPGRDAGRFGNIDAGRRDAGPCGGPWACDSGP